ncbi:EVE domain-containing protein [Profundibacterium mesophilum]|uniref:EVE domain-containing protein n=1 Tax=Profundibacterium mesophilum KAUST100406-0324 TaxID=1037889 RepID=A0A921NVB8_9RHOB|nr:EVE domain-containing protein [Profundibacterium mesophilum]KAF0676293.1 hypothetical protein PMES_01024 [Profundibacterium mesophilum KAUST100406-0324]
MQHWLFKSEPSAWSWQAQLARGAQGEEWSGVRNYQARNNMRRMAVGDLGLFYHSQRERAVVGIVEVIAPAHPDSTAPGAPPIWDCVDIRAVKSLARPVTLAQIKARPELSQMALVRFGRLSVQPVRPEEWALVLAMSGTSLP